MAMNESELEKKLRKLLEACRNLQHDNRTVKVWKDFDAALELFEGEYE
jgi:hypothetical protein